MARAVGDLVAELEAEADALAADIEGDVEGGYRGYPVVGREDVCIFGKLNRSQRRAML